MMAWEFVRFPRFVRFSFCYVAAQEDGYSRFVFLCAREAQSNRTQLGINRRRPQWPPSLAGWDWKTEQGRCVPCCCRCVGWQQLLKATHTDTNVDDTKENNEKKRLTTWPAERGWIYVPISSVLALHSDKHKIFHSCFLERQEFVQTSATNEQMLSFYLTWFQWLNGFCICCRKKTN